MRDIVIFRHQLFKLSEQFITLQAEQLKKYNPLYLGRTRFGVPPEGAESFALDDLISNQHFFNKLRQAAVSDPHPYLKLLQGRRPALIHAHFAVDGVFALSLARKAALPLVTTFHGFDATVSDLSLVASAKPSWINYVINRKKLAKYGDLFLCVSEFIRSRVIQLGFPQERTFVHYTGINLYEIQPRTPDEEQPFILHVARLVEKKGTEYLIRAFAQVSSQFPQINLSIIGEGPLRTSLERLSRSLGLACRVQFFGAMAHEEVLAFMRKSALLVLPSVTAENGDAEGLGMVLLEAAALAIPVIATDHGGIPEVVVDAKTGYLVPERDVNVLAESIISLMSNAGKRREMGNHARELVERHFDIDRQTEKLEKFYGSVL